MNGGIENACKYYNENKIHCNICEKTDGRFDNECKYVMPKLSAAGIYYKSIILRKAR
jgi:hypothetical protein